MSVLIVERDCKRKHLFCQMKAAAKENVYFDSGEHQRKKMSVLIVESDREKTYQTFICLGISISGLFCVVHIVIFSGE